MLRSKRVYKKRSASRSVSRTKKRPAQMVRSVSTKSMAGRLLGRAMPAKLHYSDYGTVNPGVGGIASSITFNLSSIYDPNVSGAGHQPLGHDQLALLFERYQVWKVDFHIEFSVPSDTSSCRVGYRVSDASTAVSSETELIENGNAEWALLTPAGGSKDHVKFVGSVDIPEVHGLSYKQYMANDDYGAVFGSNPTESAYFFIWADGLGVDTNTMNVAYHFVYHTKVMGAALTNQS